MRCRFIFSVSTLALGLSAAGLQDAARAQTAPPPDVAGAAAANAGPEIVVVADRAPEALDQVGQSVTVLTLPQIRADQELTVADILDRTPGVSFARNGGVGETTSLYIRGAETDQTATIIDGVKLNDPSAPGGGFNFGDLLVSDIAASRFCAGRSRPFTAARHRRGGEHRHRRPHPAAAGRRAGGGGYLRHLLRQGRDRR